VGAEAVVRAPEPGQLPGVTCAGLALEVVRPDSSVDAVLVMPGEKAAVAFDQPGRWVLSPIVLTEDAQGFPSEDAAALEDIVLDVGR
jgi:hypothetical protein